MCSFVCLLWIEILVRFVAEDFLTSPFVGSFADAAWNEIGPEDFPLGSWGRSCRGSGLCVGVTFRRIVRFPVSWGGVWAFSLGLACHLWMGGRFLPPWLGILSRVSAHGVSCPFAHGWFLFDIWQWNGLLWVCFSSAVIPRWYEWLLEHYLCKRSRFFAITYFI